MAVAFTGVDALMVAAIIVIVIVLLPAPHHRSGTRWRGAVEGTLQLVEHAVVHQQPWLGVVQ
ncbi:MAG: hypothetical protein ACO307_13145, partial [Ilumatobacteraceae bacterium]